MLTTLHAKPTQMTYEEYFICNNDRPSNAECLADMLNDLELLLENPRRYTSGHPWVTVQQCLDTLAEQIANIAVLD